jgi:hybrid cluster-associated redox disulfide protein
VTRPQKLFIYASGVYLLAAAVFGILDQVSSDWIGGAFAYSHFYLLGFISMLLFGLGYYLFPRLNRSRLRFPKWVTVHLVVGNLSLVGLVLLGALHQRTAGTQYLAPFVTCVIFQVATLVMFVVNIWITLTPPVKKSPAASRPGNTAVKPRRSGSDVAEYDGTISADMLINNVMRDYPRTQVVFTRYFGPACTGCPAQAFESIALACRIHDADLKTVLDDLNAMVD